MGEPTLDWLKTLCRPEGPHVDAPFSVTVKEEKWLGATNGHALVLIRTDGEAPPFAPAQDLTDLLVAAKWSPVPFDQVEAWALRQNGRCEDCGGLGFRFEPDLAAFDSQGYGPEHNLWKQCWDCRHTERVGTIAGVRIDRFLLLRYLGALKAGQAAFTAIETEAGPGLGLRAPGWMLMIMGVLGDEPGEVFEAQRG